MSIQELRVEIRERPNQTILARPLAARLDALEVREAGWERSFRELAGDYAELAQRMEALEQRLSLVVHTDSDGWVQGNGLYPYDDVTENHE